MNEITTAPNQLCRSNAPVLLGSAAASVALIATSSVARSMPLWAALLLEIVLAIGVVALLFLYMTAPLPPSEHASAVCREESEHQKPSPVVLSAFGILLVTIILVFGFADLAVYAVRGTKHVLTAGPFSSILQPGPALPVISLMLGARSPSSIVTRLCLGILAAVPAANFTVSASFILRGGETWSWGLFPILLIAVAVASMAAKVWLLRECVRSVWLEERKCAV